jgi:hypothetical protein
MDPIFAEIATALVGKATGALFDLVRSHMKGSKALEKVTSGDPDPEVTEALALELEGIASQNPDFDRQLRSVFSGLAVNQGSESVANSVQASRVEKLVQARDIGGDVNL